MLLIDGVRYGLRTPASEAELEQAVVEHAQDIFGQDSIYFDRKQRLKSVSGIGSIPDGYVIILGDKPEWHIVEVELSSHPLHEHIVPQVSRFITGISNPNVQRGIVNAIDEEITKDGFLKLRLRKAIEPTETHRFLTELVSKQPMITIIIEKETEELGEALSTLRYPQIKVVAFQTFTREEVGLSVHAHLFEPVYAHLPPPPPPPPPGNGAKIKDLVDAGIIQVGQVIYRLYKGQRFEGKVLNDGSIELAHTGERFGSLSGAAKDIAGSVDGWTWWHTKRENGTECLLDTLRGEYRATHPSKP